MLILKCIDVLYTMTPKTGVEMYDFILLLFLLFCINNEYWNTKFKPNNI